MSFTVSGKLKQIMDVHEGTSKAGKEWKRQEFILDTSEQYNPFIQFSCFGEKVSLLNGKNLGDTLEVSFNLSSKEYNGKYYTQATAWKIENGTKESAAPVVPKEENDLPF